MRSRRRRRPSLIRSSGGAGLSDRISEIPTLEHGVDDVRIVMDTTGCERTAPSIPISGHGRQKVLAESRPTSSRVSPISFSAESFRNRTSGRRKHRRRCAQSCQAERRADPRRSSTSDSTPMRRAAAGAPRTPPQGTLRQGRGDTGSDRAAPTGRCPDVTVGFTQARQNGLLTSRNASRGLTPISRNRCASSSASCRRCCHR